jgi:hypothetical protein
VTAGEARERTRHYPAEVVDRELEQAGPLGSDARTLLVGSRFPVDVQERAR